MKRRDEEIRGQRSEVRVQITHRNLTVHTRIHLQHRHRDEEEEEGGKKEGDENVTQRNEQTKRRI